MFTAYSNPLRPKYTSQGVADAANSIGVNDPNRLLAVVHVETGGTGYQADGKLKMLFEPHLFYAALAHDPAKLAAAVSGGLAYRKWGEKPYPRDSYGRLVAAMAIDESAALASASWGLPQILGSNCKMAGFSTPQAMVSAFAGSEDAQILGMARFLKAAGLVDALKDNDWTKVARGYNGPAFATNHYDAKLEEAFRALPPFENVPSPPQVTEAVHAKPDPFARIEAGPAAANPSGTQMALAQTDAPAGSLAVPVAVEILPPAGASTSQIAFVQNRLRELGYLGVGATDGDASDWTEAAVLDFRNQHNKAFPDAQALPLTPDIDSALIVALADGPAKPISARRATATASSAIVATRPSVIAAGRNKALAWIVGVPSALAAAVNGVLSNLSDAKSMLSPLKDFVSDVPGWAWAAVLVGVSLAVWTNAHNTQRVQADETRKGQAL